jgi:hypothetical protein
MNEITIKELENSIEVHVVVVIIFLQELYGHENWYDYYGESDMESGILMSR